MKIPGAVLDPDWDNMGGLTQHEARRAFEAVAVRAAEWARKEALKEAAAAIDRTSPPQYTGALRGKWDALKAVRALFEEDHD